MSIPSQGRVRRTCASTRAQAAPRLLEVLASTFATDRVLRIALIVFAVAAMASPLEAQVRFGAEGSYASDYDFGVGGRVELPIATGSEGLLSTLFGVGSFVYYFPDCDSGLAEVDCSLWELNAGGAVALPIAETVQPYAGAGVNVARVSVEVGDVSTSSTETGVNLFGGVRLPMGNLTPFGEARIVLGGSEQFVLTIGALFGGP
jgi:hypothetical protein